MQISVCCSPGSVLEIKRHEDNIYDWFAVSYERIVGRVPIQFSSLFAKLIE